ncbi:MAG TPA: deoxyuridine 5'-triphosphate nucleotidohydrolase [Candidatus Eisenbergiella merdipullorum]|uniref:dUTP diphosphatase n=1 Tax=Candidatus Eisenbergiella merdipullorum TaxID=2838553 RepID=A0A9D2L0Y7_9FIRM|nr:deoxyuridine 5'-triphosphate nucleotidohydrolase [Candidatus Eisenbergiella merdipullorum]
MRRIAKFEKVSEERFLADFTDAFPEYTREQAGDIYEALRLPERATRGSAGYDFFLPAACCLKPGETVKIPTGIRVRMEEDWVLQLYPRSGLGFKYRLQLNNTVGIIDSDYYYSDNEGHIFARITNDSNEGKVLSLNAGDGFMQGILLPYGITEDDSAEGTRNGGFGSTGR